MLLFMDTNVFIKCQYSWDTGRIKIIRALAANGWLTILSNKILIEEINQHIKIDLKKEVENYNRFLSKESKIRGYNKSLEINVEPIKIDSAFATMQKKCLDYFTGDGIENVPITSRKIEDLVYDYINKVCPFETAKRNEFKDAIIIYSLKEFQLVKKEKITIFSFDKGFCKAFENDSNYLVLSDFSDIFQLLQNTVPSEINHQIQLAIESDDIRNMIMEYWQEIDVELYLDHWMMDSCEVDEIYPIDEVFINNLSLQDFDLGDWDLDDYTMTFKDFQDGYKLVQARINVDFKIMISFRFMDLDKSYYDRETHDYLVKNYLHIEQSYLVNRDIIIEFDCYIVEGKLYLENARMSKENGDVLALEEYELIGEKSLSKYDEGCYMPVFED